MRLLWIGAAVLTAAVLAEVAVVSTRDGGSDEITVGDCLDVLEGLAPTDTLGYPPAAEVKCGDPKAAYRVALLLSGADAQCPAQIYIVRRANAPDGVVTMCMTFNVDAGECFVESPTEAGVFDCALGPRPGGLKILRVLEGVVDAARCDDIHEPGVLAALIPDPAKTFCYQEFDEGGGSPVRSA